MRKLFVGLLFVAEILAQSQSDGKKLPVRPLFIEEPAAHVPMRDGVVLVADVFRPDTRQKVPAILVRTPYGRKGNSLLGYRLFVQEGYAVVIQDVRGRYGSAGKYGSITQEGRDGNDTINWIAEQPWSNGRVGMAGASYLGMVQWWAAIAQNPHLKAIAPMVSGDDEYFDRYYSTGGALKLGHRLLWISQNLTPPGLMRPKFNSYISLLPQRSLDKAATFNKQELWRSVMDHPSYDSFWKKLSIREQMQRVSIPVLSMGGWFDNYGESDLDAFARLRKRGVPCELWIGPWAHNFAYRFPTMDFGSNARVPTRSLQLAWFNRVLKQEPQTQKVAETAPLHLFVMGPNVWREEREWPLARTRYTSYYLASNGRANSAAGDGVLRLRPQPQGPADKFTYDPSDPVPTKGGAICCDPVVLPPGPLDQTAVEKRQDVLVYTSEILRDPVEVTGPVNALLYIATSAIDTDFTAKLVDVFPNGKPLGITDGILRLRYRLSPEKPVLAKRNTPYQILIRTGVTSYVFAPGHRIRVEISSSNFPRYDRNLNTGRPVADETTPVVAQQTVFHNERYPSAVILPIIPRSQQEAVRRQQRAYGRIHPMGTAVE